MQKIKLMIASYFNGQSDNAQANSLTDQTNDQSLDNRITRRDLLSGRWGLSK